MDFEKYFKEMYRAIWQSEDLDRFDRYYAKDFYETISCYDDEKHPIEIQMGYEDLFKQALWQKENYRDTTFEIKKFVAAENRHLSVQFYSTSIEKKSGGL